MLLLPYEIYISACKWMSFQLIVFNSPPPIKHKVNYLMACHGYIKYLFRKNGTYINEDSSSLSYSMYKNFFSLIHIYYYSLSNNEYHITSYLIITFQ